MGYLDKFELIDNVTGTPSVSITKNGISFNKATIEKLGRPQFVRVFMDKLSQEIAIAPCERDDRGARNFYKFGRDTAAGIRWNNADLKTTIEKMMIWDLELQSWKANGFYAEEDNALIFRLQQAKEITQTHSLNTDNLRKEFFNDIPF